MNSVNQGCLTGKILLHCIIFLLISKCIYLPVLHSTPTLFLQVDSYLKKPVLFYLDHLNFFSLNSECIFFTLVSFRHLVAMFTIAEIFMLSYCSAF